NFRSTPAVIQACNRLFADDFFSGEGIRYDNPVLPGRPDLRLTDHGGQTQPAIELLPLPATATTVAQRQTILARAISNSIQRLLSPSGALYLFENGKTRTRIQGNSIFILTRKAAESRLIARTLREDGIPCAFFKEEGLFQSPEARAVAELLDAILHPEDQTRINRALLTPFFGCRPEALLAFRESAHGREAFSRLASWHQLALNGDVAVLLDRIRTESGVVRRLLLMEDSYRTLANILHLFEILTEEAESGRAAVADLWRDLVHWSTLSGETIGGLNNLQRLETDLEAVQILTMHKSKGLEAGIVYLFGGFTDFRDSLPLVIRAGASRAVSGPLHPRDALVLDAVRRSENERLLYVALTRAKGRLCLPVE
ncbi:MAG TPA: 3'-5' exonuclease, partial [Candidatus Ozemobacteraceae bacterium]|nr:3'-5' exonuclease [Candidatus Ozemobacteraceae bacterium]